MFTKQEASILKQQFWTSFGQYMAPVPSANGLKINWINYKTGIKDLYFKMDADNKAATISIIIAHSDAALQTRFYNQFKQVKNLLKNALQEEWQWALLLPDENNKTVSRIYTSLTGVSIFKKEDWPQIISFFKPRIIALDNFWYDVKDAFEI
ncbi:MAG: DUF4268 domain-containing protein [Bacteroidota bacterium]